MVRSLPWRRLSNVPFLARWLRTFFQSQFGYGIVGGPVPKQQTRENQVRLRELALAGANHFEYLRAVAAFSGPNSAEQITHGSVCGIELARCGFCFLVLFNMNNASDRPIPFSHIRPLTPGLVDGRTKRKTVGYKQRVLSSNPLARRCVVSKIVKVLLG